MIAAVYASILTLLIVWLSLRVIRIRRRHRISIGDHGNKRLRIAIAAQQNATEYIPVALILLICLEINSVPLWIVHAAGVSLVLSRGLHAHAMFAENLMLRVRGMQITFGVLIGLAILNLFYLPWLSG